MTKMTYNEIMDSAKSIGNRIKQARNDLHLTQEDVADHLKIGRPAYSNIENGHSRIKVKHLDKLARFLGKSVDYFLYGLPSSIHNLQRRSSEGDNSETIQADIMVAIRTIISRLSLTDQLEILLYIQYRFTQVDQIDHLRKTVDDSTPAELRETLDHLLAGIVRDLSRKRPDN
jgi:transcriptional regulator with XRE-family HTH domain